ncbi:MAG: hypothetical protein A2286_00535 [Gammaproteobacteria bacterium RIFOXYA12_FULL_61_12]|nr:MAG: hypothetical protein A2514_08650 [Gammaproteobacteria bacterium RIFOXYD12_FULL_61_37]OGT94101.1 MAG: hypothetical protein A2286_00535 [Gammaproteobacteria bacterium RIFOXYA12_FULL_61_12]
MSGKGVFSDLTCKRWGRFWLWAILTSLVALSLGIGFIQVLMVTPRLALLDQRTNPERALHALIATEQSHPGMSPPSWLEKSRRTLRPTLPNGGMDVRAAFYVGQDPNSLHSLKENATRLSHVIPEAFYLGDMPPRLVTAPQNPDLIEVVKASGLKSIALLNNNMEGVWQPEAVETLLREKPEGQRSFAEDLANRLSNGDYSGVLIDWQQVDPVYRPQYSTLMAMLASVLHAHKLELWLAVPVGLDVKLLDLDTLAETVDHFLAMLYDENGEDDPPGPLASQPWFNQWLEVLLGYGDPKQWVIGIGSYGYDWPEKGTPETIGFLDAMARAQNQPGTAVFTRAPSYSPHFSYNDRGKNHQVWFLDAISFRNQVELARQYGVAGIALYRLGTEDPKALGALAPNQTPQTLSVLESPDRFTHIGEGDFLRVENAHSPGRRKVQADDGELWSTEYEQFPVLPTVYHAGAGDPDAVAISFDDGPDPQWTPDILDVLKEKGVKASFFVIGSQAALYPDLVRRIVDEGHELGVHLHPSQSLAGVAPAPESGAERDPAPAGGAGGPVNGAVPATLQRGQPTQHHRGGGAAAERPGIGLRHRYPKHRHHRLGQARRG